MTWLWIGVASGIGAFLAALAGHWAQQNEAKFFADPDRVARAAAARRGGVWRLPLAFAGALAMFGVWLGASAMIAGMLAAAAVGQSSIPIASWLGLSTAGGLLALLACGAVVLPAAFLCRCPSCAGLVFDQSQPLRKGFAGIARENWLIFKGRGRCPKCSSPPKL